MILWKVNTERECMCDTKIIKYCSRETLIHETIHISLFRNGVKEFGNEDLVHALETFVVNAIDDNRTIEEACELFFTLYDNARLSSISERVARDISDNLQKTGYTTTQVGIKG